VTGRGGGPDVLRERPEDVRVTFVELFFDLVYVLAVTQLTEFLREHLTGLGVLQSLLLLLAIWWAWVDTAWVTNWFDPDRTNVRLTLLAVVLLSLVMSATLGHAYGSQGLWFAGAYAAMQIGRSVFAVLTLRGQPGLRRNFQRILVWKSVAGALWVAGGFAHGTARVVIWVAGVAIEYVAAAAGFYVPGWRRSAPADWPVRGAHLAARCQLFILIALGESILVTGRVFANPPIHPAELGAFVCAFLGSVALWWIYFDRSAESATDVIARAGDPGRLARSAYTYFHLPMVAGIVAAAVGDELTADHPLGHSRPVTIATLLAGPALFLAGHTLFKRSVFGALPVARLAAIGVLAALVPVGLVVPPVALSASAALVVVAVAAVSRAHEPGRIRR
jgi:low temperature requirement protein LtrA